MTPREKLHLERLIHRASMTCFDTGVAAAMTSTAVRLADVDGARRWFAESKKLGERSLRIRRRMIQLIHKGDAELIRRAIGELYHGHDQLAAKTAEKAEEMGAA